MASVVTFNGINYSIPANREPKGTWGVSLSAYLVAISSATLQKSGGLFTLTSEVDFGASHGIKSLYFKSGSSNIASTGILRLANNEGLAFRNAANSADIALKVNASDRLEVGGVAIPTISSTDTLTNKTLTSPAITTPTGIVKGDVGLGNVDNTSDASKPVSTATQAALDLKANIASPTFTGTVSGVTASMVGLGNVDNTSDATKNSATATFTNKTIDGASNTLTVRAASDITGQLPITNGGTGQATANAALNALLPNQATNATKYLQTDGSNTSWAGSTSAAPYPGAVDGVAVATGNVGEIITATLAGISQASPVSTTYYDDSGTLSLTAGNWLIYCSANFYMNSGGGSISGSTTPLVFSALRTGSTTLKEQYSFAGQVSSVPIVIAPMLVFPVSISSTTVYKQSVKWEPNSGSPTLANIGTIASSSTLFAVRVG